MTRYLNAKSGRPRQRHEIAPCPPRKEDRECCRARALPDGRLPIGHCSPGCLGRPEVWAEYILDRLVPA